MDDIKLQERIKKHRDKYMYYYLKFIYNECSMDELSDKQDYLQCLMKEIEGKIIKLGGKL